MYFKSEIRMQFRTHNYEVIIKIQKVKYFNQQSEFWSLAVVKIKIYKKDWESASKST